MDVLLHTCCAPCATAFFEGLAEECRGSGEEAPRTLLFWYNPNIHPVTEYRARRDSLAAFAGENGFSLLLEDEYGLRPFLAAVFPGNAGQPGRCGVCYRLRLLAAAKKAAETGCAAFSTTLTVSPYQDHGLIRRIGEECGEAYGVAFRYWDFRPWFREGMKKARDAGRYAQKYCGCILSEEERYSGKGRTGQGRAAKGSDAH